MPDCNRPSPEGYRSVLAGRGGWRPAVRLGQIPLDPTTGKFERQDIEGQARQSLDNVKAIVEAAGLTLAHVVKVNVSITDMNAFAKVNAIYAEYFTGEALPARAVVEVAALPKQALIEIEAIAHR